MIRSAGGRYGQCLSGRSWHARRSTFRGLSACAVGLPGPRKLCRAVTLAGWAASGPSSSAPGSRLRTGHPGNCDTASSPCSPTAESGSRTSRIFAGTLEPPSRKRFTAINSAQCSSTEQWRWTGSSTPRLALPGGWPASCNGVGAPGRRAPLLGYAELTRGMGLKPLLIHPPPTDAFRA